MPCKDNMLQHGEKTCDFEHVRQGGGVATATKEETKLRKGKKRGRKALGACQQ